MGSKMGNLSTSLTVQSDMYKLSITINKNYVYLDSVYKSVQFTPTKFITNCEM